MILLFLLLISETVKGQIHLGLKGGLNYVNNEVLNAPGGSDRDNQYRFGYHAGIFAQIQCLDKLSLRPELLFSNKGYKFEGSGNAQPAGGGSLHLNYINLPILIGYEIVDKLTFSVGPELGYLLSAKSKFDSEIIDVKSIWDNEFDFGLSTGVSYSLDEKVIIGIRYTHGLSSVLGNIVSRDANGVPLSSNVKYQNRAFQLSIAYQFK